MLKTGAIQMDVAMNPVPTSPQFLKNVVKCSNPRCITSTETGCESIFRLSKSGKYRCLYCNQEIPVRNE